MLMPAADDANTVPNLDAMSHDDLWAFWKRYSRPSRKDAMALVGARKGYTTLAKRLAAYACNKAVAMQCREEGNIQSALCYEAIADSIYARLPADLRW